MYVYLVNGPNRPADSGLLSQFSSRQDVSVTHVKPLDNELETWLACVADHVNSDRRDRPFVYISNSVSTWVNPVVPALEKIIETLDAEEYLWCHLHRWSDRCDFMSPIVDSLFQTRAAHGGTAMIVSWNGARLVLNDMSLREWLKGRQVLTQFPPTTKLIPSNLSKSTLAQWASAPTAETLTLDSYLSNVARAPTARVLAISPCMFQWKPTDTTLFEEYDRTHECARVDIPDESRAAAVRRAFRRGLWHVNPTNAFGKSTQSFEWILLFLFIALLAILIVWSVYKVRKNASRTN